jgi:hypothetical protein
MVPSLDSQIYTSPTFILSLWGALLSTVLGIIKLFEYRKDRANIKVTVKGGYKQYPPDPIAGDYHLLLIDAVNIGRRPANITSVALMLPKEGFLLCVGSRTGNYPVELTEGKSHSFTLDEDRIKEKYKMTPSQYVGLVCDATGRKYYSHSLLSRLWKVGRV